MTTKSDNATPDKSIAAKALLRFVYREVLAGDRRKFVAKAADANTGGGARDFRFSPYDKFGGIFEKMLTGRKFENRTRDGVTVPQELLTSRVQVARANGKWVDKPIEFEPPTTARPAEGRLTRLNSYALEVPSGAAGRILLILFQTGDQKVWLSFATEAQLNSGKWEKSLTRILQDCLAESRPVNHAAQGFHDFSLGSGFCKSSGA